MENDRQRNQEWVNDNRRRDKNAVDGTRQRTRDAEPTRFKKQHVAQLRWTYCMKCLGGIDDIITIQRPQKIVEPDLISGTDDQDVKGFGHFFGQYFIIASSNRRELRTNCMQILCWIIMKLSHWNLNGSNLWFKTCPFDRKSPVLRSFPDVFKQPH
jgi:hypothetical protein